MFDELLSYDPAAVEPQYQERMASILRARGEILRASAEVSDLRARAWAGEQGIAVLIELKAANLAALRQDYTGQLKPFFQDVVDVQHFKELVPMLVLVVLQGLKVPLPVLFEAVGVDFDTFKTLAEQLKEVISEL